MKAPKARETDMLKSKFMAGCTLFALTLLSSQIAWAGIINGTTLPGPGVLGLIAAGVIISIAVSRSRK